ncbi:hypothetical protein [Pseudoalteromonas luteoviolacea]|uniref:Uncharacterized protein n=1 Tax=Pseudoalteromonas luteoviolacea NCIMB 1942 TaxID=1365253 RepID=A0A166Z2C0_9GAMM|nr:hypothetical protein [Pseudoalteromonas luteoviolacea]KZN43752.1 hypothetical protein N482_18930 [Pseudoalteromonas luteoviolacea NCIMB 1942]KZX01867.1 hypothetical protein JL49_03255 [Pseudoalteromonas luteoviolacea]
MAKHFAFKDLLLPYVVMVVVIFIIQDATYFFFLAYISIVSLVFLIGHRLRDVNICSISFLAMMPVLFENIIFTTGLISLVSEPGDRLIQNSLIYGIHLVKELMILVPLTYRVEISKKLFPKHKIRYTFADSVLPWLCLISAAISFFALIENYMRNGKGYDITFFYYAFDVTGYLNYSMFCGVLVVLTFLSYKEAYDFKAPSIRRTK